MGWAETLVAAADKLDTPETDVSALGFLQSTGGALRGARVGGGWLLKEAVRGCTALDERTCQLENIQILACFAVLSVSLVLMLCVFAFLREDKEENITPLCPQLIVKDQDLRFEMPSFADSGQGPQGSFDDYEVLDQAQEVLCRVVMDFADPSRAVSSNGVAATMRIMNQQNCTLATVCARNVAVAGQGLALCRAGCEIFGFVEPEGANFYSVRHRTGVELLTFAGDFENWDIEVANPVGLKVCHFFRRDGDAFVGHVLQHVDAGLVLCGIMAAHVHRQLTAKLSVRWDSPPLAFAAGTGHANAPSTPEWGHMWPDQAPEDYSEPMPPAAAMLASAQDAQRPVSTSMDSAAVDTSNHQTRMAVFPPPPFMATSASDAGYDTPATPRIGGGMHGGEEETAEAVGGPDDSTKGRGLLAGEKDGEVVDGEVVAFPAGVATESGASAGEKVAEPVAGPVAMATFGSAPAGENVAVIEGGAAGVIIGEGASAGEDAELGSPAVVATGGGEPALEKVAECVGDPIDMTTSDGVQGGEEVAEPVVGDLVTPSNAA